MPTAGPVLYDQHVKWLPARAAALPVRLQDLALALVLAAANVGVALPDRSQLRPAGPGVPALVTAHPLGSALALLVLQALPLTWRRSWPVAVFLVRGEFA